MGFKPFFTALLMLTPLSVLSSGEAPQVHQSKVLLRDDFVLDGVVTERFNQIIVRSGKAEVRLSRDQVLCWADSIEGIYQYYLDRRTKVSFESHLTLAQWCLRNDYPAGATRELIAARQIRPNDPATDALEAQIRQAGLRATNALLSSEASGSQSGQALQAGQDTKVPETFTPMAEADSPAEPISESIPGGEVSALSPELLRSYITIVQPLLLNRCATAGCHDKTGSNPFELETAGVSRRLTASESNRNAEEVRRWISPENPEMSPLFVLATTAHGDLPGPPLGLRDRAAIESLRNWLRELSRSGRLTADGRQVDRAPVFDHSDARPGDAGAGPGIKGITETVPTRIPPVDDPFDPEVFNRVYRTADLLSQPVHR